MKTETAIKRFTALKVKVDNLFALQKITPEDIEGFTKPERDYIAANATEKLQQLKGQERDNFISKIELVVPVNTKNQMWEYNHFVISGAISKFMREYGIMPDQSTIAEETGLSRQTVAKHLKEYKTHPAYAAQLEQFKFMAPKIMAKVFKFAVNGDVKAARLYFEMVGAINKQQPDMVVNKQNNYIQINNTILSQENLSHLSAEQLNQIESIIAENASR